MEVVQQDRCRSSLNGKVRRKSKMKILKKLKPEERGLTRTLWEQVFTEDTKEFLDYYYTEKTKNNEIYVIETDHDIRAMMQLNPYVIQMGKKAIESRYIVAVATEPLYRHRGYMAELLSKTARDLYQQKMPFFFLMPASEKIYYPHNYRFIYAADVWSVKGTDGEELTIQKIVELQNDSGVTLRKAEGKDCKKLGDFAEEVLEKQKIQVYTKRDAAYYMRLLKEQESEKGGILIAEQDGEMRGILVFDEEDLPHLTSIYPEITDYLEEKIADPEWLADLNERLEGLAIAYEEDKSIMRFRTYNPIRVSGEFQKFAAEVVPYSFHCLTADRM